MSTLSKENVLLQENDQNNNNNNNDNNNSNMNNNRNINFNVNNNNNEKNKLYSESFYSSNRSRSQRATGDNDSIRSVEVLSLTPSFMDIPGNNVSTKRKTRTGRDNMNGQIPVFNSNSQSTTSNLNVIQDVPQSVPRFSKMGSDDKFINSMSDPNVNPVIGTSMYDNFDSHVNNSNNNNNNNVYPISNNNMATNNDKDMFNNNSNNTNVGPNDMDMNNLYSSDMSPMNGLQFSSPPSQLLSEQGFADLDNFMSTL